MSIDQTNIKSGGVPHVRGAGGLQAASLGRVNMAENIPARKFLFEQAFGVEQPVTNEPPKPQPVYTEEEMLLAKEAARNEGVAIGKKMALDESVKAQNAVIAQMEDKISALLSAGAEVWRSQIRSMEQLALAIVRKMMPEYAAKHGLEEIGGIVTDVISQMSHEPRIVVRVSERQFENVNLHLKQITEKAAFDGKLVIIGDPSILDGDCRVEWADGGIERDQNHLWQEIERVMHGVQQQTGVSSLKTGEHQ